MTITEIKREKGHIVRVTADYKSFLLESDYATEIGLKVGCEIPDTDFEGIIKESEYRRARSRGLWLLDRGDKSKKTLIEKITAGGISKDSAIRACDRFCELGLLDDRRYAENLYDRLKEQNISKRMAYVKMIAKGIPSEIIKDVLENDTETDETAQVLGVIEKKYRTKIADRENRPKVTAALLRRGFNYSAVKTAMAKYDYIVTQEDDI